VIRREPDVSVVPIPSNMRFEQQEMQETSRNRLQAVLCLAYFSALLRNVGCLRTISITNIRTPSLYAMQAICQHVKEVIHVISAVSEGVKMCGALPQMQYK
jgi:hypothetical protein